MPTTRNYDAWLEAPYQRRAAQEHAWEEFEEWCARRNLETDDVDYEAWERGEL